MSVEQERFHRQQNTKIEPCLPDPMPGRLPDGTQVWLHYSPVRWERHA